MGPHRTHGRVHYPRVSRDMERRMAPKARTDRLRRRVRQRWTRWSCQVVAFRGVRRLKYQTLNHPRCYSRLILVVPGEND